MEVLIILAVTVGVVRADSHRLVERGKEMNPDIVFVVVSLFIFAVTAAAIWAFEKV